MHSPITAPDRLALRLLSLAYFVQAVGALSVVGSLEAISTAWALSSAQSALLITVFGITFALAAPLLQMTLGHLRRRAQVLLGLSIFSAAALLFAAAPDYQTLLASRVLMGLGAGFIGPVLGALGSNLVTREQQGSAIAIVLLGLSVAGLAGMPISAWIAHEFGARSLFFGIGASGLLIAAMIFIWVPDRVAGQRAAPADVLALLTGATSLSAFLVVFFVTTGVFTTYAFLAPIIGNDFHGSAGDITLALTVQGVAGVLGNLLVTRLALRVSAERLLLIGIGLLALDLLGLAVMPRQLGGLLLALVIWALATDIVWPSQQRRIVELMPEQRGIALALTASFMFAGIGSGSAVAAWLYPVVGYKGLLLASLLFLLLAFVSLRVSEWRARVQVVAPGLS
ncbi:MFS transporter [Ectopseudomonas mendocina]|uniref:MFS transporter n=1 Tax=Ectopseudomonas mendocina S5.2 TaxID=1225174 RepID=A0ABN4IRX4_ECTME|nr:MFS transporter [Pseudomonas mendocina]ALN18438.1 MFS transporter [Pseudomonas mendocina S5.2]KES00716.1 major facilitator transporter [Pseudomonas mendocina]